MTRIEDKTTVDHDFEGVGQLAPGERQASLLVYHRDGVKVVPLGEGRPAVVGRAWPADVVVPDLSLSRQHVKLTWTGDHVEVEDLGSTNGTRVAGETIREARVAPGESIVLGAVTLSVNVAGAGQGLIRGIDGWERFLRRLDDEVVRARTFGRPLTLLMIRALGREEAHVSGWVPRLRSELRPVDHMTVYGPGSVLVLLPETSIDEADRAARGLVSGRLGEPPLRCGIASQPPAANAQELIDAARQAARRATDEERVRRAGGAEDEAAARERSVVIVSPRMQELHDLVRKVAASSIPVLVLGETGTGKEVLARAIHRAGPRRDAPLRTVNCGAIPGTLIESVLFGHVRGAFTGADRDSPGLFEQADGGTLLLDEVGELSPAAQAALLRVLETKRVTRVGATDEIPADVRVVAATHRDLEAMVAQGQFRQDLLYRLNTMVMRIPPLRERPEEIEALAELFAKEASRESGGRVRGIDAGEARERLRAYAWPGNVRELRNVIERAVVVCGGETIGLEDLPERIRSDAPEPTASAPPGALPPADPDADFKDRVRQYETQLILDALERAGGNQTQAAKLLRMPLRTLVHKLKQYGIKKHFGSE